MDVPVIEMSGTYAGAAGKTPVRFSVRLDDEFVDAWHARLGRVGIEGLPQACVVAPDTATVVRCEFISNSREGFPYVQAFVVPQDRSSDGERRVDIVDWHSVSPLVMVIQRNYSGFVALSESLLRAPVPGVFNIPRQLGFLVSSAVKGRQAEYIRWLDGHGMRLASVNMGSVDDCAFLESVYREIDLACDLATGADRKPRARL